MPRVAFYSPFFLILTALTARAETSTFSFIDPKGVNAVTIRVDAPLNTVVGFASGLRGEVVFDPAKVEAIKGELEAPLAGITLPNDQMREVLMTRDWLNAEEFPVVKLVIKGAKEPKAREAGIWELTLDAELNCRGTMKPMSIPATLRLLKGQARERGGARSGDLLFLKAAFVLKRSDFGIKTSGGVEKVGDQVMVSGEVVGYAP